MASQVLPINQLDQAGLILDMPPVSLPPNAFSDVQNVRFKNGAVQKMEGEVNIFPNLFDDSNNLINGIAANFDGSLIKYIAWWDNPNITVFNQGYYLVIAEETRLASDDSIPPLGSTATTHQRDIAYLVTVDGVSKIQKGVFEPVSQGNWQHTFFQGGFALIINNGLNIPHYILDINDNTDINVVPDFAQLPGWDSYEVNQIVLQDTFDPTADSYIFDLGQIVDFDIKMIEVTRVNSTAPSTTVALTASGDTGANGTPNNIGYVAPDVSTLTTSPWTTADEYEIYYDPATNTTVLNLPNNISATGEDTLKVSIKSRDPVYVSCGVIRSFGDFLVAGNLVERAEEDLDSPIIRNLNGVVRTSDAAPPGAVPNNWNPFAAGVSTADEFVLADTGIIQDMVSMQGNLYIYSNDSISVMRLTGSPTVPLAVAPVTQNYGCHNTNAVIEFDGKHFVVGSQDIYLFGGHPGSIESVAEGRVRQHFSEDVNPLHSSNVFVLRYEHKDEIWVCYPSLKSINGECDDCLIWNYRHNTWTHRQLRGVIAGDVAPVPGGGLPSTDINFANNSGNKGVINIGAQEVRTLGIDPSTYIDINKLMYVNPTGLMYKTGRNGAVARLQPDGVTYQFYQIFFFPIVRLEGPEGISTDVQLYDPLVGTTIPAENIIEQLVEGLEAQVGGWSTSTLPLGYSQLTGSNRLVCTVDDTFSDSRRVVDSSIPFTASIISQGNTLNAATLSINIQDSALVSSVYGLTKDSSNDYRGVNVLRATPTYIGFLLNSSTHPSGQEFILVEAGEEGTYDPDTHTGTNGVSLDEEGVAERVISKLRYISPSLKVIDTGTAGEVKLLPANYSSLSNFIIDFRVNDNQTNADWIYDRYQEAMSGTIGINSSSDELYLEPTGVSSVATQLRVQSIAPTPAGSLDSQLNPDPTRVPNTTSQSTTATLSFTETSNTIFDVYRPWSVSEVNPNVKVPVFACRGNVVENNVEYTLNKVIATDIGWSIPTYAYSPRVAVPNTTEFRYDITGNDAPASYESFVERKQFAITPDFDTETIKQIILWVDGYTVPYINADNHYNRLQVRIIGTENPGQDTDMSVIGDRTSKNTYFVSESYKLGMRAHGRFLNLRITDEILDDNQYALLIESNPNSSNSINYTQESSWSLSGIQAEINKGGRR